MEQYIRKAEGFVQNLKGAKQSKVVLSNGTLGTRYAKNGKYIILDNAKKIISFGAVN